MRRNVAIGIAAGIMIFASTACSGPEVRYHLPAPNEKRVLTGLEVFLSGHAHRYKNKRCALVTNHSGVDYDLNRNIDLLRNAGIQIMLALAPEHGINGFLYDYEKKNYSVDQKANLIVYNLHMLDNKSLAHLFRGIDVVIFDIQDLGMRCYTYISDLRMVMDALAGSAVELLVFDRPNPVGVLGVAGPYLDARFYSRHIGAFPAPLLYDMTPGEAARYYQARYAQSVRLEVMPMQGYRRGRFFPETMLPWVPPSPNLPTPESAILYAAVVLLEGVNINLGRGTAKPFEYVGAPWIDPDELCADLQKIGLAGLRFRPVYFQPTFSKYRLRHCGGVQLFYVGGRFDPVEVSYKIIQRLKKLYPRAFAWERTGRRYTIDYLAGTDHLRMAIESGKTWEEFRMTIANDHRYFDSIRRKCLLYD